MYFDILLFSQFLQCILSVGLYYNHIGKEVHMTCKTNDPDPSFKMVEWRVTKRFGGNNDLIYYRNWTINDSKYKFKDIDGVRYFIIRNFSVEDDGKYCYYCSIVNGSSNCINITNPVRKYYYSYLIL
jgi:hypothetical protein